MRALAVDAKAAWRRRVASTRSALGRLHPFVARPFDEDAAKGLVEAYGLVTPLRYVSATHDEAIEAFRAIGRAVVVKVLDSGITHKTQARGVHTAIRTETELARALAAIDAIPGALRRYLVEEMAPEGVELIIGGVNDPSYGATVLVGLGGTAAEAIADTAIRLAPLAAAEAAGMLEELTGLALLDGWRGAPPVDRDAVVEAIVAVGTLLTAHPEIRELDLNPIRAYPDGILVLDALVVL